MKTFLISSLVFLITLHGADRPPDATNVLYGNYLKIQTFTNDLEFIRGITTNIYVGPVPPGKQGVVGVLEWEQHITWFELSIGMAEPGVNYETGVISSNLAANFTWKGEKKSVVLETKVVGKTNRSYTIKQVREYR